MDLWKQGAEFSWALFNKQANVIIQENERLLLTEYG